MAERRPLRPSKSSLSKSAVGTFPSGCATEAKHSFTRTFTRATTMTKYGKIILVIQAGPVTSELCESCQTISVSWAGTLLARPNSGPWKARLWRQAVISKETSYEIYSISKGECPFTWCKFDFHSNICIPFQFARGFCAIRDTVVVRKWVRST